MREAQRGAGAGSGVARGRRARLACMLAAVLVAVSCWAACGAGAARADEASSQDSTAAQQAGADGAQASGQSALPVGIDESSAAYTSISRLAGADASLDNTLVTFRGEAVGEPINSSLPGYKWVLLQTNAETTSSIEVLMTDEQVALIEHFGSYRAKGSTLRVTGIYRVADPNQTGNLDVTAYSVRVVDPGGPVESSVDYGHLWAGVTLVAVGLGLVGVNGYLRRRSRS